MESSIKLVAQILFGSAAIFFLIYSIVAIYSLNTYGLSKNLTSAATFIYSAAAAGILVWGMAAFISF